MSVESWRVREFGSSPQDSLSTLISFDEIGFGFTGGPGFTEMNSPILEPTRFRIATESRIGPAATSVSADIGQVGSFSFDVSVPGGGLVPMAGITWASTLPNRTGRGVLTSLIAAQLQLARDLGEPVAGLWASEAGLYRQFGFGPAAWRTTFTITNTQLREDAPHDPSITVDLMGVEALDEVLMQLTERSAAVRPGVYWPRPPASSQAWVRTRRADDPSDRGGRSALRGLLAHRDGEPLGVAYYATSLNDHQLSVRELISEDPEASAAIWRVLLGHGLATSVVASRRPVDDPLLWWLADPRAAAQAPGDSLHIHLVDPVVALAARRYLGALDVVLRLLPPKRDGLARSSLTVHLVVDGDGVAEVRLTGADADVTLTAAGAGALYLGGTSLSWLIAGGLATAHNNSVASAVERAFSSSAAPWSPFSF